MKKATKLMAAAAFVLLALGGYNAAIADKKLDKLPEEKVTLDRVPAEVQKSIKEIVGNGRLVDIGAFTQDDGSKLYEIEFVVDGKEYDVLFDENGKVLRKTFEGNKIPARKKVKSKSARGRKSATEKQYQKSFGLDDRKLVTKGKSRFFILEPGYRLVLEGKEGKRKVRMEIIVTDKTREVDGVTTRVVEERETINGELYEISINFFAICEQTKSVFYFGEEVDFYKDGKVVGHAGAWMAGENGAKPGMIMPGEAVLGARFYQEVAPKVAMDRCELADMETEITTPAGRFTGCLKTLESNPLDGDSEYKVHAPGIGLVRDENLLLVEYGYEKN